MKFHRRRFLHLAGVAAAIAVLSVTVTGHGAWSQTARTIKVVVSVQPGGGADFLTCRQSLSLATRTMMWKIGSGCPRRRRLRRKRSPNSSAGSRRHFKCPTLRQGLPFKGYIRSGYAALISALLSANNMTTTAAQCAGRTSSPSNLANAADSISSVPCVDDTMLRCIIFSCRKSEKGH
jgi:hypothetical protein